MNIRATECLDVIHVLGKVQMVNICLTEISQTSISVLYDATYRLGRLVRRTGMS